jgi:hypothetical protein
MVIIGDSSRDKMWSWKVILLILTCVGLSVCVSFNKKL